MGNFDHKDSKIRPWFRVLQTLKAIRKYTEHSPATDKSRVIDILDIKCRKLQKIVPFCLHHSCAIIVVHLSTRWSHGIRDMRERSRADSGPQSIVL